MHPFMMSSTSEDSDELPTSVRGAPPELRRVIRKRQNSESAKRCRQRKKLESARASQELTMHANHLARLELIVQDLARRVDATATVVAQLAGHFSPNMKHETRELFHNTSHSPLPNNHSLPPPPPLPNRASPPDFNQMKMYDEVAAIVA